MGSFTNLKAAIIGLSIGGGIFLAGWFIGNGFTKSRMSDRYVTVKGLSEKEVNADLAIWPITFRVVGNNLIELQKEVDNKRETINTFLVDKGFNSEAISHSTPKINDNYAQAYYGDIPKGPRYVIQKTITLRSSNVALVKQSMEQSGVLVEMGIVLSEDWENRTEFLFTSLNDIKPQMIQEATINAREAANKFAEDSGSKVGKIRKASQGFFNIENRDANSPDQKIVRVVTTVEFFLTDN
ncbi:MAG: SIMPL domain-containing protein [Bacteroidales bacterium]|nr:SIMPL domain-containing protein [Bacteroidales bacterium]MCF8405146.1 SIMPL domain-containing protein [Bacteroidales bacterium]